MMKKQTPGQVLQNLIELNIMLHNATTKSGRSSLTKEALIEMIQEKTKAFDMALDERYALIPGIRPHI
jgi:CRISPR/Cas system-associated protein Csm6